MKDWTKDTCPLEHVLLWKNLCNIICGSNCFGIFCFIKFIDGLFLFFFSLIDMSLWAWDIRDVPLPPFCINTKVFMVNIYIFCLKKDNKHKKIKEQNEKFKLELPGVEVERSSKSSKLYFAAHSRSFALLFPCYWTIRSYYLTEINFIATLYASTYAIIL